MKKLRKAYIALIMAFLYAPIVLLILYSFWYGVVSVASPRMPV